MVSGDEPELLVASTPRGNAGVLIGVGVGLAIALLLVIQAVSSSGGVGTGATTSGVPSTSTSTSTSSMSVFTSTVTNSSAASSSESFHYVTFIDSESCGDYLTEWGVQLGNRSITVPANVTISELQNQSRSISYFSPFNYTTIVFLVPSGVYNFTVYPTSILAIGTSNGSELGGPTGVITVTDSDMTVYTIPPVGSFC
jgi:hypothetical protein